MVYIVLFATTKYRNLIVSGIYTKLEDAERNKEYLQDKEEITFVTIYKGCKL